MESDERRILARALARVPLESRRVLWLRHVEGLSFRHIGERCALPPNTAKTRHRRALLPLRRLLEQRIEAFGLAPERVPPR